MAQGEYVWVAEADDYADKDFLAAMVPVLDRHPSVGFVYCQSWAVNERGAILRSMSKKTGDFEDSDRWERDYVNQGRDECRRYLLMRNIVPNLSGVLFRREVMERIGCFDETFRVAGDYVTWVKMALNGDVAYVARPLNYFRHHAGAVRHKLRSGVSVHENYAVLRYISRQLHLSNAEINPVCDRMLKMWTRRAFTVHGRIPIRMSMEIYRTARQVDHRLFRRFLWQLLPKGLRRTRKSAKASLPRDEGGAKKEGTPFVR